ncbi:carbohydrate-binding module family 12 protein [Mycena rebaudengoi]|nr:carbohydrate-binding module family 12 protein [Mycena rebaudengoi]
MTQYWEPGTPYHAGAVVSYEGHNYKIIQPHTSQSDWAPTVTPALWGRLDDHDGGHHEQHHQPQQHHDQQHHFEPEKPHHDQHPGYDRPPGQTVDIPHEEQKKHWYDLDDDRKKQLEIGGGLLAGSALLAGGFMAWKHHEKSEEEQKAQTWGLQNWAKDCPGTHRSLPPRGSSTIPPGAIVVGQEHSWKLYICRAFCDGGIQIGKASDAFKKGAVIGYCNEEIHLGTYEILVGDMNGLRWVDASGRP